jgi:hypothetical protein
LQQADKFFNRVVGMPDGKKFHRNHILEGWDGCAAGESRKIIVLYLT